MGEGSLLLAANEKWPFAQLIGNDLDDECVHKTKKLFPNLVSYNHDFSSKEFLNLISKDHNIVDLCLGNPPFKMVHNTDETKQLLVKFKLDSYASLKNIPIEIIYMLLCINATKLNGEVISILPDSIFVNEKWTDFRKFIITNYDIKIIELPSKIFSGTEAKTHILILKISAPKNKEIQVSKAGIHDNTLLISFKEAIERMDYSYWASSRTRKVQKTTISTPIIDIIRGRPIKRALLRHHNFLHTSDLQNDFQIFTASHNLHPLSLNDSQCKIAQPGDIIIPRVGTRCLGRVGYVQNGYFAISDCLFILRTKNEFTQRKILELLKSEDGKNWIKSISKGVAARHITIKDVQKISTIFHQESI